MVSCDLIERVAADFDLLAHPLAVTNTDSHVRPARFAPFPILPLPTPPAVGIEPTPKERPTPAVPPAAAAQPLNYWRKRRSRSFVSTFGRNFATTFQSGWNRFSLTSANFVCSVDRALKSVVDRPKPEPTYVPDRCSTENSWVQIEFDLFKDPLAAVDAFVHAAAREKQDSVPPVSPPPTEQAPKYGRTPESHLAPAAVESKLGPPPRRSWDGLSRASANYARSVYRSFVRDCRCWFHDLTLLRPALKLAAFPQPANGQSAANRSRLAPIINWLQQPITPVNSSCTRPIPRSAQRPQ